MQEVLREVVKQGTLPPEAMGGTIEYKKRGRLHYVV